VTRQGVYNNCEANFADLNGVNAAPCAQVEFDDPEYTVVKTSDPVPGSTILPARRSSTR